MMDALAYYRLYYRTGIDDYLNAARARLRMAGINTR